MDFSKLDGLIPAVIQDDVSGVVLRTKGETSGNRLRVERVLVDCDEDTVLVKVTRLGDGNVCHTGERTCFNKTL
jgi:phosphoribosyl-AMP cyclohydrolase